LTTEETVCIKAKEGKKHWGKIGHSRYASWRKCPSISRKTSNMRRLHAKLQSQLPIAGGDSLAALLFFFLLAQFFEYREIFQCSCVARDTAVSGKLTQQATHDFAATRLG
jgi:hypothetical protein